MKESDYISDAMLNELKEAYPDEVQGYAISSEMGTGKIKKSSDEVKFYIDGDEEYPTICGTGTEDYFGGS